MLRHRADRRTVLWAFVLFPAVGFAPVRRAAPHPVAPAAQPLLRLLCGRLQPQPQPLPDVQEPKRERVLLGVAQRLLRVPDVRLDPDAQPEPSQVREQGGGRDHHLALLEEEHVAHREHVLLRLGVLAGGSSQGVRRQGAIEQSGAPPANRGRNGSTLAGTHLALLALAWALHGWVSRNRRLDLRLRVSRRSSPRGR